MKAYWPLFLQIFIYCALVTSLLWWGIPGSRGVFLYHMDEWHQLMSVRSLVREGTPNVVGSANGPILQFIVSGVWLAPAILSSYLNLDAITTPITGLEVQEKLFLILRLNTLFFGVGTICLLHMMLRNHFKIPNWIATFFAFSPVFLFLSNYFKYDIALLFWITLAIYLMLWFGSQPSQKRFVLTAIPVAAAVATKISAAPLVFMYFMSYFIYVPAPIRVQNLRWLSYGLTWSLILFCCVGIPDLLFLGKGEYLEFLYDNIVSVPLRSFNFNLPYNYWLYLLINQFPLQFGVGFVIALVGSFCMVILRKNIFKPQATQIEKVVIVGGSAFLVSLLPLKMYMVGNRWLVLLPFLWLLLVCFATRILKHQKTDLGRKMYISFLISCLILQFIHSISWLSVRWYPDPRATASAWISKHLPKKSSIGLEEVPLYQMIPDVILSDYYSDQYLPEFEAQYQYQMLDAQVTQLPQYVIVSNVSAVDFEFNSPKKALIERLGHEKFRPIATFTPELQWYKQIGTAEDFYFSGLPAMPLSITIYSAY